jgi:hypothetical protein
MTTLRSGFEVLAAAQRSQPLTKNAYVATEMVRFLVMEFERPSKVGRQFKAAQLRRWVKNARVSIGGAA